METCELRFKIKMLHAWTLEYIFIFLYICPLKALQYSSDEKSHTQASDDCRMKGTRLVKIDTDSKYETVKRFIELQEVVDDVWIDLRSEGQEYDVYRHSDGEKAIFFKWDTRAGEPNYQDTDRCIRLHARTIMYRTWNCNSKYHFICETTEKSETTTLDPVDCDVCECNIFYNSLNDPTVLEAMKERIQDIKQTLSLNKSDLSKQVRRKISAPDKRMSSTLLGCVGVVFLVFSIGVIVIPDTIKLIKYLKGKHKTTNQS